MLVCAYGDQKSMLNSFSISSLIHLFAYYYFLNASPEDVNLGLIFVQQVH